MKANLSLPLPTMSANDSFARSLFLAKTDGKPRLARVEWIKGNGPLLHPSPLGEPDEVLSLNLGQGSGQRSSFCFVGAYPTFPVDEKVHLYYKIRERLEAELAGRRKLPRAVVVTPATDPFPPLQKVQAEAIKVMEVLASRGVSTFFMTRGYIRPAAIKALTQHRDLVKVTVGLTTLNRGLQRVLEPWTAPPRLRLRQIAELQRLGIPVQVALEPLIPTLTDTRANLEPLLEALALAGIRQVTAGYLLLRSGNRERLQDALEAHGGAEQVLNEFETGVVLAGQGIGSARYLSKARRQRGYALLMALASALGIDVRISRLTNPDFGRDGGRSPAPPRQRLLPLFPAMEGRWLTT